MKKKRVTPFFDFEYIDEFEGEVTLKESFWIAREDLAKFDNELNDLIRKFRI